LIASASAFLFNNLDKLNRMPTQSYFTHIFLKLLQN